jgi:hypothetical protein
MAAIATPMAPAASVVPLMKQPKILMGGWFGDRLKLHLLDLDEKRFVKTWRLDSISESGKMTGAWVSKVITPSGAVSYSNFPMVAKFVRELEIESGYTVQISYGMFRTEPGETSIKRHDSILSIYHLGVLQDGRKISQVYSVSSFGKSTNQISIGPKPSVQTVCESPLTTSIWGNLPFEAESKSPESTEIDTVDIGKIEFCQELILPATLTTAALTTVSAALKVALAALNKEAATLESLTSPLK